MHFWSKVWVEGDRKSGLAQHEWSRVTAISHFCSKQHPFWVFLEWSYCETQKNDAPSSRQNHTTQLCTSTLYRSHTLERHKHRLVIQTMKYSCAVIMKNNCLEHCLACNICNIVKKKKKFMICNHNIFSFVKSTYIIFWFSDDEISLLHCINSNLHFNELKILRQPGYLFFKLNQQYFFTV